MVLFDNVIQVLARIRTSDGFKYFTGSMNFMGDEPVAQLVLYIERLNNLRVTVSVHC
jgi:hypothetical protein